MNDKDTIDVIAAIIEIEGKFLIGRRKKEKSLGGKWEFPGGKLEPLEEHKECLIRELREEFGVEIEVGNLLGENTHDYGWKKKIIVLSAMRWGRSQYA